MARKKRTTQEKSPNSNSYRVISHQAEESPFPRQKPSVFRPRSDSCNILGQPGPPPRSPSDNRHNRPNPNSVGFLRQDVRLLNEPVCNVMTAGARDEHQWWPTSRFTEEPAHKAPYTRDTTMRNDFQYSQRVKGSARHTSNPHGTAARGAVPVNLLREADGSQRFWKEGISYEHQYNSRTDPSYPIRATRHGAFVVTRTAPPMDTKMQLPPIAT